MKLSNKRARDLWIHAQRLNVAAPFGKGAKAVEKAVEHLGYVQIDTISVVERCHHHILFTRIPDYKRSYLHKAQSIDKSVFEYWTHALSYVPVRDFRFFVGSMKKTEQSPGPWLSGVKKEDIKKVEQLLKKGPISIRDIKDDVLVSKDHEWASRKPSKKALLLGFYSGRFVVSERQGMIKKYDFTDRHFDWNIPEKPVSASEYVEYIVNRSLRSQGVVSLDSICHLDAKMKPEVLKNLEARKDLIEVVIEGAEKIRHWMPKSLQSDKKVIGSERTHILSPFDPLIIQRKRLKMFFGYEHLFEAYVPKEKRKFGYFSLPVLNGHQIIALLDLKTDRQSKQLLIQNWAWLDKHKSKMNKKLIEDELHRFSVFQLSSE